MNYCRLRVVFVFFFSFIFLSACTTSRFQSSLDDEKVASENPEIQRRAGLRMQLAIEYFQQGQFKPALEEIRQVVSISPKLADAYSLRALIQMEMKDFPRAEENFLHALKLEPTNSEIMNNYAWFLCQNGREKAAMLYFEKVLNDRSYLTPVKALISAGVCSLRLKDVAGAERYFVLGSQIQPANPNLNANLAKIYFDRGEYAKARPFIQRVLKEEIFAADVLWLAIKIDQKLGDQESVKGLATQLRRRHPSSAEFALFQKGAFNE